jgi:hypothetical protein
MCGASSRLSMRNIALRDEAAERWQQNPALPRAAMAYIEFDDGRHHDN